MSKTNTVELYEDNGGGLFLALHGEGGYYADLEHVPAGQFLTDATALLAGDVSNWTAEHYSGDAPGELVATVSASANGPILDVVNTLGRSAERYVGKTQNDQD